MKDFSIAAQSETSFQPFLARCHLAREGNGNMFDAIPVCLASTPYLKAFLNIAGALP